MGSLGPGEVPLARVGMCRPFAAVDAWPLVALNVAIMTWALFIAVLMALFINVCWLMAGTPLRMAGEEPCCACWTGVPTTPAACCCACWI